MLGKRDARSRPPVRLESIMRIETGGKVIDWVQR